MAKSYPIWPRSRSASSAKSGKDFWDILSSMSTLISGGLIAGLGAFATMQYNEQQIELRKVEALDKYRTLLLSEKDQEREFGYQAFVALGYENLALKLIALRKDVAGVAVVQQLAGSSNVTISKSAQQTLLSLDEKRRVIGIVDIFETGSTKPNYGRVSVNKGSDLYYGIGASLQSGELAKLINAYVGRKGAIYSDDLTLYVIRLTEKDVGLTDDEKFISLLRSAGDDPAMHSLQDEWKENKALLPALQSAERLGVKTPLGIAAIYDTFVHGGFARLRDQTNAAVGGTPAAGIDEKLWVRRFVEERRDYLANSSNEVLRRTVYRPDAFLKLIDEDNWSLKPPLNVHNVAIDN